MKRSEHLKGAIFFLAGAILGGGLLYFGSSKSATIAGILSILAGIGYSWRQFARWLEIIAEFGEETFGSSGDKQEQKSSYQSPQIINKGRGAKVVLNMKSTERKRRK